MSARNTVGGTQPLGWVVLGGALTALVMVAVFLSANVLGGAGSTRLASNAVSGSSGWTPAVSSSATRSFNGVFLDDGYTLSDFAVVVRPEGSPSVQLIDAEAGRVTATIAFDPERAAYLTAVERPTRNELLVATGATLSIHDLARELRVVRTIDLPNKIGYTIYAPTLTLSADERYLYFGTTDPAACEAADLAGAPCMAQTVTVVDLEAGRSSAVLSLPDGCHWVSITAAGPSDAVLACSVTGEVVRVTPDGHAVSAQTFTAGQPFGETLRAGFAAADGLGAISVSGVGTVRSSSFALTRQMLPPGMVTEWTTIPSTLDGLLVVAYREERERRYPGPLAGFVIFRTDDLSVVNDVRLASTVSLSVETTTGVVRSLTIDGTIREFDARTGVELREFTGLPSSTQGVMSVLVP